MRKIRESLAIGALPRKVLALISTRTVLEQAVQGRQQIVRNGKARLHVTERGRGAPIVFIPS